MSQFMFGWLEFFFCYDNVVRLTDTQIERGHGETNSARGNFSNLKKKELHVINKAEKEIAA